jgi:hypothetical protein
MSYNERKLPTYLSWKIVDDLYYVQVDFGYGGIQTAVMHEEEFNFAQFKKKLQDEFNIPFDVLEALSDVVSDLCSYSIEQSQQES